MTSISLMFVKQNCTIRNGRSPVPPALNAKKKGNAAYLTFIVRTWAEPPPHATFHYDSLSENSAVVLCRSFA